MTKKIISIVIESSVLPDICRVITLGEDVQAITISETTEDKSIVIHYWNSFGSPVHVSRNRVRKINIESDGYTHS